MTETLQKLGLQPAILSDRLGKSTLVSSDIKIPMPAGAVQPKAAQTASTPRSPARIGEPNDKK